MRSILKKVFLFACVVIIAVLTSLWLVNTQPSFEVGTRTPRGYFLANVIDQSGNAYQIYPEGWHSADFDAIVTYLESSLSEELGEVIVIQDDWHGSCTTNYIIAIASRWELVSLNTRALVSPGKFPSVVTYTTPQKYYHSESWREYGLEVKRDLLSDGYSCSEPTITIIK